MSYKKSLRKLTVFNWSKEAQERRQCLLVVKAKIMDEKNKGKFEVKMEYSNFLEGFILQPNSKLKILRENILFNCKINYIYSSSNKDRIGKTT